MDRTVRCIWLGIPLLALAGAAAQLITPSAWLAWALPANASIWESQKACLWPIILYWAAIYFTQPTARQAPGAWWLACTASVVTATTVFALLHYFAVHALALAGKALPFFLLIAAITTAQALAAHLWVRSGSPHPALVR